MGILFGTAISQIGAMVSGHLLLCLLLGAAPGQTCGFSPGEVSGTVLLCATELAGVAVCAQQGRQGREQEGSSQGTW